MKQGSGAGDANVPGLASRVVVLAVGIVVLTGAGVNLNPFRQHEAGENADAKLGDGGADQSLPPHQLPFSIELRRFIVTAAQGGKVALDLVQRHAGAKVRHPQPLTLARRVPAPIQRDFGLFPLGFGPSLHGHGQFVATTRILQLLLELLAHIPELDGVQRVLQQFADAQFGIAVEGGAHEQLGDLVRLKLKFNVVINVATRLHHRLDRFRQAQPGPALRLKNPIQLPADPLDFGFDGPAKLADGFFHGGVRAIRGNIRQFIALRCVPFPAVHRQMFHPFPVGEGLCLVQFLDAQRGKTLDAQLVKQNARRARGIEITEVGQAQQQHGQHDVGRSRLAVKPPILGSVIVRNLSAARQPVNGFIVTGGQFGNQTNGRLFGAEKFIELFQGAGLAQGSQMASHPAVFPAAGVGGAQIIRPEKSFDPGRARRFFRPGAVAAFVQQIQQIRMALGGEAVKAGVFGRRWIFKQGLPARLGNHAQVVDIRQYNAQSAPHRPEFFQSIVSDELLHPVKHVAEVGVVVERERGQRFASQFGQLGGILDDVFNRRLEIEVAAALHFLPEKGICVGPLRCAWFH